MLTRAMAVQCLQGLVALGGVDCKVVDEGGSLWSLAVEWYEGDESRRLRLSSFIEICRFAVEHETREKSTRARPVQLTAREMIAAAGLREDDARPYSDELEIKDAIKLQRAWSNETSYNKHTKRTVLGIFEYGHTTYKIECNTSTSDYRADVDVLVAMCAGRDEKSFDGRQIFTAYPVEVLNETVTHPALKAAYEMYVAWKEETT